VLKGSLDDFTLPEIFRLLASSSKTGSVQIHRSAGRGEVYFRQGEVYFAESSLTRDPLGQKLVRARLITELQLRQALDEHAETGNRLGEVLVAEGVLEQSQIEDAVRQQIEDAIFDLLRWELGEFSWEPGKQTDAEVPISVSVENLIMEASRKLEELEVITKQIPSETAILAMASTPPEGAAEINITPEEWRILVLVDGVRNVSDIALSVGLDNFSAMRTLYGLSSAGLIAVVDAPERPALEEFAEALRDEAVDEEPEPEPEPAFEPEPVLESEPPVVELEPEPAFEAEPVLESEPVVELDPEPAFEAVPETETLDQPNSDFDLGPIENPFDTSPQEAPAEIPVTAEPAAAPEAIVDRLAAVRELADLFDQKDSDAVGPPYPAELHKTQAADGIIGDGRRRVEDDEEITKGLISRLIDGVKGL
jgi:hypothetical protein